MKFHPLLILLIILLALLPIYYFNRWLQKTLRPRESPAKLFLYFIAHFLLVILYTGLLVGIISRLFIKH